jgi:radical SAM protein with 4Fe4S-binding SPASM domain
VLSENQSRDAQHRRVPGRRVMTGVARFARKIIRAVEGRIHHWAVPRLVTGGYIPGPHLLLVQLNYKCNLRCSFCGQWGSTGIFKNLPAGVLRQTLPLSVLQRVIRELPITCRSVFLWGGETLQYLDLIPLIRCIKERGMVCALVTNGTFLPKHARSLVEADIDEIDVSLDAMEETHDRLRGAPGTFQAALEGIRIARTARSARGSRRPLIIVNTTLFPAAVGELPALIRQLRLEGVDFTMLGKLQYATREQGEAHEKVFQKLFQIIPTSWKGFERRPEPEGAERIRAAVEELLSDGANKGFVGWGNVPWGPRDFYHYYLDPTTCVPADRACRYPWDAVSICPNGDVTPCPDFPDVVVGNVKQESLPPIWNGPRFRDFRRKLAGQRRFPICTTCCHFYNG